MLNKEEFISEMNKLGAQRSPFIFIIDFDFEKPLIFNLNNLQNNLVLFKTENYSNFEQTKLTPPKYSFSKEPIIFEDYKTAFNLVMKNILAGNSYLLNLTFPTKIETDLSMTDIFNYSKAKYKLYLRDKFVCFSPEIFVKINNNIISSYPMKGTINADIPNALEILMNDEKEVAEHNTIVDLIRNDLSIVSKRVRVKKFRYADYLKTSNKNLIQISSEISGELPENWRDSIGTIISKLLPAGSVSGAPKSKTVEIIKEAENYDRGYYTGIFGIFDGISLDSAVIIRYIENTGNNLIFKSGGGITAMSELKSEYNELIDKIYVPIY